MSKAVELGVFLSHLTVIIELTDFGSTGLMTQDAQHSVILRKTIKKKG